MTRLCEVLLDIALDDDSPEWFHIFDECRKLGIKFEKTGVMVGGGWPEYRFTGSRESLLEMIGS